MEQAYYNSVCKQHGIFGFKKILFRTKKTFKIDNKGQI